VTKQVQHAYLMSFCQDGGTNTQKQDAQVKHGMNPEDCEIFCPKKVEQDFTIEVAMPDKTVILPEIEAPLSEVITSVSVLKLHSFLREQKSKTSSRYLLISECL
jgi:hypothetical protein